MTARHAVLAGLLAAILPATAWGQASTRYVADPAVHRQVEAALAHALAHGQADREKALAQSFAAADPIATFDRQGAALGLHSGDDVDAYTGFWLECWHVANDDRAAVTRAQAQAVRGQVAGIIARSATADLKTDADRQTFAETLIYRTLIMDADLRRAQQGRDDDAIRRIEDEASRALPGLDQRALVLTPDGFQKKE